MLGVMDLYIYYIGPCLEYLGWGPVVFLVRVAAAGILAPLLATVLERGAADRSSERYP